MSKTEQAGRIDAQVCKVCAANRHEVLELDGSLLEEVCALSLTAVSNVGPPSGDVRLLCGQPG